MKKTFTLEMPVEKWKELEDKGRVYLEMNGKSYVLLTEEKAIKVFAKTSEMSKEVKKKLKCTRCGTTKGVKEIVWYDEYADYLDQRCDNCITSKNYYVVHREEA